jgi:hypothetical protein
MVIKKKQCVEVYLWHPVLSKPVENDCSRSFKNHGVEFRNTGATNAWLDGFVLIRPNEVKFFGASDVEGVMEKDFNFTFKHPSDDKLDGYGRLEVIENKVKGFKYDCI